MLVVVSNKKAGNLSPNIDRYDCGSRTWVAAGKCTFTSNIASLVECCEITLFSNVPQVKCYGRNLTGAFQCIYMSSLLQMTFWRENIFTFVASIAEEQLECGWGRSSQLSFLGLTYSSVF